MFAGRLKLLRRELLIGDELQHTKIFSTYQHHILNWPMIECLHISETDVEYLTVEMFIL